MAGEDRSDDGFYTVTGLQAPSVFHRKDGMAVVLWKASWTAVSSDAGQRWSKPVKAPTIVTDGAKVWGQRTKDGRYAMVYNPANDGTHRWPLAIATSDDGVVFDHMLAVHGEVAPRRFIGHSKDFGSQYVRGISEGDGDPPGTDMWVTYSGNKEDIWISRIPVPVRYKVEGRVNDNFDDLDPGGKIPNWNIYRPRWASAGVAAYPSARNKSLELEDRDPYDYARAVRVFSETKEATATFKVLPRQSDTGRLEMEILDASGHRPVRVQFGDDGKIEASDGAKLLAVSPYQRNKWYRFDIVVHAPEAKYDLSIDGKSALRGARFAEDASTVERLSFRTGAYRTEPTRQSDRYAGADLPNPDTPVPAAIYYVDDVTVK